MAAKLRNFTSLLKMRFSWPLKNNRVILSGLYSKNEIPGLVNSFSTVMNKRVNVLEGSRARSLFRNYHVGFPLGIKAAQLSKDMPLEKADVGCPICSSNILFSYKDVLFLSQFLSPEGNLLNKRITGVCGKQQRKLEKAIKISRRLGLLPKCGPAGSAVTSQS